MSKDAVIDKLSKLSEEEQQKVAAYVEELLEDRRMQAYYRKRADELGVKPGFGGAKGMVLYMADDFDAPLEDFKDYM